MKFKVGDKVIRRNTFGGAVENGLMGIITNNDKYYVVLWNDWESGLHYSFNTTLLLPATLLHILFYVNEK